MNPMEDVLGATLYSNRYGGHVGVGLVYVKKLDRQKMVGLLKEKHPDHKTSEYGSRTLYSWTVGHHGKKMDLTGTFASDTLIVIGADAEQVKAALDVLDGKKPGLAKDAPLIKGIPKTALFASRGIDVPEDYRKTTRCPVLHNCKAASAVWTEKDGRDHRQVRVHNRFGRNGEELQGHCGWVQGDGRASLQRPPSRQEGDGRAQGRNSRESRLRPRSPVNGDVESAVKAVMEKKRSLSAGKEHGKKRRVPSRQKIACRQHHSTRNSHETERLL